MSALAEALLAAQRQAIGALSKAYAEYAYAIGKLGEGAFERVYRVVMT